ncbi:hypothetical protein H9P43_005717 [Blastocladiella emersonii ATCC 22665]|nr:hypothetical protein H9P43_005717 [Blastocladiella emersonii ATCC 22665]
MAPTLLACLYGALTALLGITGGVALSTAQESVDVAVQTVVPDASALGLFCEAVLWMEPVAARPVVLPIYAASAIMAVVTPFLSPSPMSFVLGLITLAASASGISVTWPGAYADDPAADAPQASQGDGPAPAAAAE